MKLKAKAALLTALLAAALWSGAEALRSLRPGADLQLPEDIYARYAVRADAAEYVLRDSGGYIAVFDKARSRDPISVTRIELRSLRGADRAMVQAGIPVISRTELLELLEDLGS